MKQLFDLNLALWFLNKNQCLCAAACNAAYYYEEIKETEKAIQIRIISKDWSKLEASRKNWTVWIPKSAIEA